MTAGQVVGGVTLLEAPTRYLASVRRAGRLLRLGVGALGDPRVGEALSAADREYVTIAVVEHMAWLVSMHVSLVADDARGRVARLLIAWPSRSANRTRTAISRCR